MFSRLLTKTLKKNNIIKLDKKLFSEVTYKHLMTFLKLQAVIKNFLIYIP